ncbi:MAG: hypothetical protein DWH91_16350 [Planctomycetota bacterium]|nr:MAG: hypothetical protein DWH91_16350 [Planctomycetota bacterium]
MPLMPARCEMLPLPSRQVSLRIDGREVARWHAAEDAPRPFLFPLNGPSGACLTRMGHPGAANHDHHRSVWFAHSKLLGIDFWSENSLARIRQTEWFVYEDGADQAAMAVRLGWFDGHNPAPLIEQETILILRPLENGEYLLDWQLKFVPRSDQIEFQQTNFGFLAVRVVKSISAVFGGGQLTGSTGLKGEKALFSQPARWMDYSGPVVVETDPQRPIVTEGVTYLDCPQNATYPSKWHVRDDGWMGCAPCMDGVQVTTKAAPLVLRYGLFIHRDAAPESRIEAAIAAWQMIPVYQVVKGTRPHHQWELQGIAPPP